MPFEEHPFPRHVRSVQNLLGRIATSLHFSQHQLLVLSVFPVIILLGQVMGYLSPDESIHNYFTSKGNILNTYFVKFGWFWTLATYLNIILNKLKSGSISNRKFILSFFRVILISIGWFLFTQWFFGPPIMDRVFVLSGGKCSSVQNTNIPDVLKNLFQSSPNSDIILYDSKRISSATCKKLKGKWEGGHDPSGHVFLLTLSVCLLIWETIEFYNVEDEIIHDFFNNVITFNQMLREPIMVTSLVVITALSMLFMTVLKYHSLGEQLAGFSVSVLVLWIVNMVIEYTGLYSV